MDLLAVRCARSRIGACQTVLCMRATCVCICESGHWLTVSLIVDFVSLILAPLDRFLRGETLGVPTNDYVHEWFGNRGMSFRWCRSRLVWPGRALAPPASASAVLAGSMLGATHFGAIWSHLRGCIELLCSWILGVYYVVWRPSGACQARYPLARKAKRLVFWQMLGYMCPVEDKFEMCAEALESMVQTWSGTLVVEDVRVNFAHSFSVRAFCHMVLADFISAAVGAWRSPVKDSSVKMKILCAREVVADMEAP
ncbi:hypothetical protein EDC04DRAFT_2961241 [Pisolithus marmoratus]|nr:hypothetical protein EDC04DRAFT_2961241 [Pisolithus marmoratus]